jgi:hypothetical protein
MARSLALVSDNAHVTRHFRVTVRMLKQLSDVLVEHVKSQQWQRARATMSLHQLSPIALGVVAEQMAKAGVSEDKMLRLL